VGWGKRPSRGTIQPKGKGLSFKGGAQKQCKDLHQPKGKLDGKKAGNDMGRPSDANGKIF